MDAKSARSLRRAWGSLGMAVLLGLAMVLWVAGASGGGAVQAAVQSAAPVVAPPAEEADPGVRLVASDAEGLVLELTAPPPTVTSAQGAAGACDRLSIAGYGMTAEAGRPELPMAGATVGIPPEGEVTLTVLAVEARELPGTYAVCPAPRPIMDLDPALLAAAVPTAATAYQGMERVRDAAVYATGASVPGVPAALADTGFIRSQRVARVRFYPVQYNPATGRVQHLRRIRVRVAFSPAAMEAAGSSGPVDAPVHPEGAFEPLLRRALLNYDQAQAWRDAPASLPQPAAVAADPTLPMAPDGVGYKLLVDADSLYRLTPADLAAAGVDVGALDPRTFRVLHRGQEVAVHVTGEADGDFAGDDVLLFYGEQLRSRYALTNVYWLTWGGAAGTRMPVVDGSPGDPGAVVPAHYLTTVHLEQNIVYQPARPSGPDDDRWYWQWQFSSGTPAQYTYTTALPNPAAGPLSATVRGLIRGYSAIPTHHAQIYLNGHLVEDATWGSDTAYAFETPVPQSYLVAGSNHITVVNGLGNSKDWIFVNWFEIDYHRTYTQEPDAVAFDGDAAGLWRYEVDGLVTDTLTLLDVTWPLTPSRVLNAVLQPEGATYTLRFEHAIAEEHHYRAWSPAQYRRPRVVPVQPADLRDPTQGADYIIVTHGDFVTAVQPLVTQRVTQGLRVAVVDVADIYDRFNHGIFAPEAIRDFLAYAYTSWTPPAPTYVLLVGDGTYDFLDNYGYGPVNYVPPYLADVDPWLGETAADNRYVAVSGGDILPDMHLGRLAANSPAEVTAMVDKILDYERNPPAGWNDSVLLVADNADSAGDFAQLSDDIAALVPSPYTTEKVYYGVTHGKTAARQAIRTGINAGQLIVNYIGHGAYPYWAGEKLLQKSDLAALTNTGKLPLFVPMTCLEGHYIHPSSASRDLSAVGEYAVRVAERGAIASWSPTGLGVASGHDLMNRALFDALFADDITELGALTLLGKLALVGQGQDELIDTYLLFGDPALHLDVLKTDVAITKTVRPTGLLPPGARVTYTLAYTNAGPATAHHVVITDLLPAGLMTPTVSATGAALTRRGGTSFVWDVADLPAGHGGVITLSAQLAHDVVGVLSNTATIATSGREATLFDNASSASLGFALRGRRAEGTVALTWDPVAGAAAYRVYRAADAYFTPSGEGTLIADNVTSPAYTDTTAGLLDGTGLRYVYSVVAVDAQGRVSAPSSRVGAFTYALLPGAVDAMWGRYNVIALPLDVTAWLTNAAALADYIGPSVEQILSWNPDTQTYRFWLPQYGIGQNFALAPGQAYWVQVDDAAPTALSFVGPVPPRGSVQFELSGAAPNCRLYDLSIPLDQTAVGDADQLAAALGGETYVEQVLEWNPETETFRFWLPQYGIGQNFPVELGYPYHVCLKPGVLSPWPEATP